MSNTFNIGDLIKWVAGHSTYQSDGDTLRGKDEIYYHGIVMEVSGDDPRCIIVHSRDTDLAPRLVILNDELDDIHILSSSESNNE